MAAGLQEDESWIVDSGSTSNMTNRKNYIKNFHKTDSKIGVAKENETMVAKGSGSIEFENCKLKDVMYVPELSTNLLSVHAITEGGGKVLFNKDEVIISSDSKTILKGQKMQNGLFQVKLKRINENKSYLSESSNCAAIDWHRKLGHISNEGLKTLQRMSEEIKLRTLKI